MNKNPREWAVWDNDFFGMMNEPDIWEDDLGFVIFAQVLTTIVGAMLGMMVIGAPLELIFGMVGSGVFIGLVAGAVLSHVSIRMGKFYKGHSMPVSEPYSYSYTYDLNARAKEYFSLPPEDRSLYPHDIINTLRDPDLTEKQLEDLNRSMASIYNGIQEREDEKRLLSKREVDIDSLIEEMNDAKNSVAIETKTYREYR